MYFFKISGVIVIVLLVAEETAMFLNEEKQM